MSLSRAPGADQSRWGRTSRIHDAHRFEQLFERRVNDEKFIDAYKLFAYS